ncbi:MAG: phosphatase PAP2 family protein [Bacteroidales bacterium]|nr:phosphatase PAP2 family protein [Candidatus Equimonas faecalis]
MKKHTLFQNVVLAVMLSFSLTTTATAQYATLQTAREKSQPALVQASDETPQGFLSADELPDAMQILPAPPQPYTAAFYNDYYYYNWGKEQRKDPARAEQASFDYFHKQYNSIGLCFEEAFGKTISEESSPELTLLLQRMMINAKALFLDTKEHYKRVRPFEQFNEPSLIQERGEADGEVGTWSFPSGHTLRAFCTAQILSEINPQATAQLMERARSYAESRLICGHHYKSDVDASIMLAGALIARLHACKEFQQQMEKAKAEFTQVKKQLPTESIASAFTQTQGSGQDKVLYNISGRKLPAAKASQQSLIHKGRVVINR